jgi:DNA-binding NtrC family response regulator
MLYYYRLVLALQENFGGIPPRSLLKSCRWKSAMFYNPFTILKHTVNVLVVDDMFASWSRVRGLLDIFGIYSVHIAESAKTALKTINTSGRRFHACLLDRGINDMERNEFYLLDTFGKTIPFLIVTARDYSEETFTCGRKGALAYIRKDSPTFNYSLVSALNKHALLNIVCPRYNDRQQTLLCTQRWVELAAL